MPVSGPILSRLPDPNLLDPNLLDPNLLDPNLLDPKIVQNNDNQC
jgi:hypothetical protein